MLPGSPMTEPESISRNTPIPAAFISEVEPNSPAPTSTANSDSTVLTETVVGETGAEDADALIDNVSVGRSSRFATLSVSQFKN